MMEFTTPATLGVRLPRLGFGAMRFPLLEENDPASIDTQQVQKMVDLAIASGVNYFDTAYMYHQGLSETTLKTALAKYPRESYILVDKMPVWMCETPEDVDRIFQDQLKKCGVEYFDFYFIHAVDHDKAEKAEHLGLYDYLRRRQAEGHIRHVGFSFHDTPDFFWEFINRHEWDVAQIQLNYLDWELQHGEQLYRYAQQKNLPLIVMEPVRGGLLASLPEDIAAPLNSAAPGATQASFALRWMAEHPAVSVVLSGMSSLAQLEENIALFSDRRPMSEKEQEAVALTRSRLLERFEIPCTGCNYCMPCPAGLDIPDRFGAYNMFSLYRDKEKYKENLNRAREAGKDAAACVACGQCAVKCPQHIDIPGRMRALSEHAQRLD